MLRFNIFNMIHKALRAMLHDMAMALQHTNFADTTEAKAAFDKMNEVIDAFEQHGHHEDSILMPLIEEYQPGLIASFEREHIEDHRMGNDLKQLQYLYHSLETAEERIVAGSAIIKSFGDYLVFNLRHMQREEIDLNKLLWDNYTDEEILKINDSIIAGISAEEMLKTSKWIMRGINRNEAENWLIAVKQKAPEEVFNSLFRLTETCLPVHFRKDVQQTVLAHKVLQPVL